MTLSFFFSFKENCVRAFLILTASANRSKLAYSFGPPPCPRLAAAAEEEEDVYTKMYPNYSYRGKKEKRRRKKGKGQRQRYRLLVLNCYKFCYEGKTDTFTPQRVMERCEIHRPHYFHVPFTCAERTNEQLIHPTVHFPLFRDTSCVLSIQREERYG